MSAFGVPSAQPSLFGAPSQPAFGTPQSSASLFGAPAASGSLFGAPQTSAFLFGAPQSSASLFGAAQSSASLFGTPQSSTSLFGAAQSSASLFGTPQPSASVFGAPQSSTSLFGAPQSTASLFGAPASSAPLFGATAPSASFANPASSSFFGFQQQQTSLFGQPQQPQQQHQQGFPQQHQQNLQPTPEYSGSTKVSSLPDNFRSDLYAVERHLREQRAKFSALKSKRAEFENRIEELRSRTENRYRAGVKQHVEIDVLKANATALGALVRQDRGSADPVVIALEDLTKDEGVTGFIDSNGLRYAMSDGRSHRLTQVPDEYFARVVNEIESRAHEYRAEIDQVADFLRAHGITLRSSQTPTTKGPASLRGQGGLLDNLGQRSASASDPLFESRGKTIEEVIHRQYEYFMVVASHVAGVHENLRSLRGQFVQALRTRDRDAVDPFQQADLREKAQKDRQRLLAEKQADGDGDIATPVEANGSGAHLAAYHSFGGNVGPGLTSGAVGSAVSTDTGGAGTAGMVAPINPGTDLGAGSSRRMSAGRRRRS